MSSNCPTGFDLLEEGQYLLGLAHRRQQKRSSSDGLDASDLFFAEEMRICPEDL